MNRILHIKDLAQAREELLKIKVSSQGIEVMSPKCLGMNVKLTGVKLGAANILKQEMLSIGGDAAVARGVVEGSQPFSDVILLANADKIRKLINKLKNQNIFGLGTIRNDLTRFLEIETGTITPELNCRGRLIPLEKLIIMGVLNITPDSFSDGSDFLDPDKAVEQAVFMADSGADIIDIGGESSRPGSIRITAKEELAKVLPVITELNRIIDKPISIDSYKSDVVAKALAAGASLVNDISALRFDPKMVNVLKEFDDVPVVLMHMQGTPETMQENPVYEDVIDEIMEFFQRRIDFCLDNGIRQERIIIDPGIGFGKRQEDNLVILKKLREFKGLGLPVMIGASRKSFIGRIYDSSPRERIEGSLATTAIAKQSRIQIIRVHDISSHKKMLKVLESIEGKNDIPDS